jgi:uncharacterized protein YlxW (UPF0749 family)
LVSQYYSGKEYVKLSQPENNAVLAIEVAKLTKGNAGLRTEVEKLTSDLASYRNSSESSKKAYDQYLSDQERFGVINGTKSISGQGVIINVDGALVTPQVVDLVNAIKNIGAEIIEINGKRLVINTNLGQFSGQNHCEIKVLGNSALLKSSMERKGGIIEQIQTKDIGFSVTENNNIEIGTTEAIRFKYAKIIDETK